MCRGIVGEVLRWNSGNVHQFHRSWTIAGHCNLEIENLQKLVDIMETESLSVHSEPEDIGTSLSQSFWMQVFPAFRSNY